MIEKFISLYESATTQLTNFIGTGWRAELFYWTLTVVIAYAAMFKGEFGFVETPYNFF